MNTGYMSKVPLYQPWVWHDYPWFYVMALIWGIQCCILETLGVLERLMALTMLFPAKRHNHIIIMRQRICWMLEALAFPFHH